MRAGGGEDIDPGWSSASGRRVVDRHSEAAVTEEPHVPFNRPWTTGSEFDYIREAIANGHLSGNGPFTRRCASWLQERTGAQGVYLSHSCTGALEMAALLLRIEPGDEVVLPSFTFASTAAAFALRGATLVFVDIRPDTLNMDESTLSDAVTDRTRAIVPVHYAGIGCEMEAIMAIAEERCLAVVEDAAQAVLATYRGRSLGAIGHLGALSFHETKNVTCGEGGALLVNDSRWLEDAEIIQEKGTNRQQFYRGHVDKYTWIELGSSYAPSEINAAFLYAQLEHAEAITAKRLAIWQRYDDAFEDLERANKARRPVVPEHCRHNAHLYYLLAPSLATRDAVIRRLAERNVNAVFHYVPLHESPAGRRYGRPHGPLNVTVDVSSRLVRLPLWVGMDDAMVDRVVSAVYEALD